MRNLCEQVIVAQNDAVSQASAQIDTGQMFRMSAHAFFSDSTAAGTLVLQASDDPTQFGNLPSLVKITDWITIPNTSQTVTAGSSVLIPSTEICYRWVRVLWTPSAGSGTISVNINTLGY